MLEVGRFHEEMAFPRITVGLRMGARPDTSTPGAALSGSVQDDHPDSARASRHRNSRRLLRPATTRRQWHCPAFFDRPSQRRHALVIISPDRFASLSDYADSADRPPR
jgi:hypothetical protein